MSFSRNSSAWRPRWGRPLGNFLVFRIPFLAFFAGQDLTEFSLLEWASPHYTNHHAIAIASVAIEPISRRSAVRVSPLRPIL